MANPVTSKTQTAVVPFVPLTDPNQIKARLAEIAIATMKEIVQENKPLSSGLHYRVGYYTALKKKGTKQCLARIEHMKTHHQFFHGIAPEEFFERVPDASLPTKFIPEHYRIKAGKSPSKGLEELRKGLTLIGCGEACQIAYYVAVQKILGDVKFDAILNSTRKWPLMIGHGRKLKGLFNPFKSFITSAWLKDISKVKKGQVVAFEGAKGYPLKHPAGTGIGYNVICIEEGAKPKFCGFGLDSKGVTQQQISQSLLESFNEEPLDLNQVFDKTVVEAIRNPSMLAANKKLATAKLNQIQFETLNGGKYSDETGMDFEVDRIACLAKLDNEAACAQLVKWQEIDEKAFADE